MQHKESLVLQKQWLSDAELKNPRNEAEILRRKEAILKLEPTFKAVSPLVPEQPDFQQQLKELSEPKLQRSDFTPSSSARLPQLPPQLQEQLKVLSEPQLQGSDFGLPPQEKTPAEPAFSQGRSLAEIYYNSGKYLTEIPVTQFSRFIYPPYSEEERGRVNSLSVSIVQQIRSDISRFPDDKKRDLIALIANNIAYIDLPNKIRQGTNATKLWDETISNAEKIVEENPTLGTSTNTVPQQTTSNFGGPSSLQQQVQPQVSSPPQQTTSNFGGPSTPSAILRTTFYNPPPPQEYDEEVDQQEEYNQGNLDLPEQIEQARIYDILNKPVEPLSGINFSEYQRIKSNIKIVVPQPKEPKPKERRTQDEIIESVKADQSQQTLEPNSRAAKYLAKLKGGYDSDE